MSQGDNPSSLLVDDVSKHLPRRPHHDRPSLKQTTPNHAPINDRQPARQSVSEARAVRDYSPVPAMFGGSLASGLGFENSHGMPRYFTSPVSPNGVSLNGTHLGLTAGHLLSSSVLTNTRLVKKNPYSRPLSATDVVPKDALVKGGVNSSAKPLNIARTQQKTLNIVQTNSFLRPQSSHRINDSPNEGSAMNAAKPPTSKPAQKPGYSSKMLGATPVVGCDILKNRSGGDYPVPTPPSTQKPKLNSQSDASRMKTQTENGASKSLALALTSNRTAHITRSRSGTPSSVSSTSSGDNVTKLRNPFYSPNKPYSETNIAKVNDALKSLVLGETAPKNGSDDVSSSSAGDVLEGHNNNCVSLKGQRCTECVSELLKDGSLKKMPVTNTLTGTVYYRKSSKSEEIIEKPQIEKRPVTEGAPDSGTTTEKSPSGSPDKLQTPSSNADKQPIKPSPPKTSANPSNKPHVPLEKCRTADSINSVTSPKKTLMRTSSLKEESASKRSSTRKIKFDLQEDDVIDPKLSERVPGDGEAYESPSSDDDEEDDDDDDDNDDDGASDDDDDDEDVMDDLDDDYSDADSDGYSIRGVSSSPSSRPSSAGGRSAGGVRSAAGALSRLSLRQMTPSVPRQRTPSTPERLEKQPALNYSLFSNIPPTVNFVTEGYRVETLPSELRNLLRWKMSTITPNVIKNCIARSGFRATKRNHDWLGYWGKHMKAPGFKAIRDHQKFNHFPGSFQIGRKDRLWRNLSRMQAIHGKKEFGFFPQTFCLPYDLKLLKRTWDEGSNKQKWIIKPPASARGIGIRVIHKWNQVPKKRPVIVQRYLSRPYLINDSKFDLRIYVYVTSYDPLRVYVYDDGLARFASTKYSYSMKNLSNRFMHLTNYSINKSNTEYEANGDENVCQGHKWGLKALWGYLQKRGVNTRQVWENIKDLVIKSILCSEACVTSQVKAHVRRRYNVHELFGFDVMLDEDLKPWIIEVNISPSLHSNSQLDKNIKGGMVKDLLNLASFMLPDKRELTAQHNTALDNGNQVPAHSLCMDRRMWPNSLSPDERSKHAYYTQRHQDEAVQVTILDTLTPDDIRILTETVDENSRRGNFERVFPSLNSLKYLRLFEFPRYYTLLLTQWCLRYHKYEARGIALLDSMCQRGIHLENPTDNPKHIWSSQTGPRDGRSVSAPNAKAALPTLKKTKKLTPASSATSSQTSLPPS